MVLYRASNFIKRYIALLLDDHIKRNLHSQEALLRLEKQVQTIRDDHDNNKEAPEEMYRLTSTGENNLAAAAIPAVLLFTTSMLTINGTNLHDKIKGSSPSLGAY